MKRTILLFLLLLLPYVAKGTSEKTLFVYSSRKEHLIKEIFQYYHRQTGVRIKYLTGKAGMLIQRLKEEGIYSPADLLLTADAGNLWHAAQQGLLLPISSEKLEKNIPSYLRDPNGLWFALSVRTRILVYNEKLLSPSAISSYENLAQDKWKGKICLRTAKKVYNQSLVAMLIHQHGKKKTKNIITGWVKNTVDIFPSDTLVLKAIAKGQCQIGIVNDYYYSQLMKKNASLPLKIYWPNQKNNERGVHINISGAGILKHTKKRNLALTFLEWLSKGDAQKIFSDLNMEYPANPRIPVNPQLLKWGEFKMNTTFNLAKVGVFQKEAIKLMNEAGYR